MHKPAQVEPQLDWSRFPYSGYSGPLLQKAAQPNAQYKKGPYTLYIGYTKRCLLKGYNSSYWIYFKVPIDRKCVYWMKYVYWPKKYLLNGKVSTDWKYAYWLKMWLLKGHNPLGINSGLYLFDNFFLNFLSFIFQIFLFCSLRLSPISKQMFWKITNFCNEILKFNVPYYSRNLSSLKYTRSISPTL